MKKKHLKNLASLEKWLKTQGLLSEEILNSTKGLKILVESVEEAEETSLEAGLPAPKEISGEPDMLAVYSDGACRGNPGPGACAYVVQNFSGDILTQGVEFEGHTTNNKMELLAPLLALRALQETLPEAGKDPLLTRVKVITDSKYVVEGMKSWVTGWKSRGWKKADNKAPENLEYWQDLDEVRTHFMEVQWEWVKGHAGHPQNEYCDRKANEAMDENSR